MIAAFPYQSRLSAAQVMPGSGGWQGGFISPTVTGGAYRPQQAAAAPGSGITRSATGLISASAGMGIPAGTINMDPLPGSRTQRQAEPTAGGSIPGTTYPSPAPTFPSGGGLPAGTITPGTINPDILRRMQSAPRQWWELLGLGDLMQPGGAGYANSTIGGYMPRYRA